MKREIVIDVDERSIHYSERPWRPFAESPAYRDGKSQPIPEDMTFWANSHYLVFKRVLPGIDGAPDAFHLSIRSVENDTRHDWRDFQRIKNELLGPEWEAVELYPAESRLTDTANQYHLWCFPFQMPFGFEDRLVMDSDESAATGATQRSRS